MRMFRILASLCLVMGGTACAQSIPHDTGFKGVTMEWGTEGTTSVFYRLKEDAGQTLVCGFWFSEGPVPDENAQRLLVNSRLSADGATMMTNLAHFTRIEPERSPDTVAAACRRSNRDWTPALAQAQLKLQPPAGRFN